MRVTQLSLHDFRSWSSLDLSLDPGATALIGGNGQGKTNIVKAVCYLATLESHRVASDSPLVRMGAERAVIRAVVERDGRDTLVELEVNPGSANRARLNRAPVPRARELLGLVRTVLFAPEDLALVRGDPAERRRFLDALLVARAPRFAGVRADYERVLKQRNALLKSASLARRSGGADMRTLDSWDAHLARTGAELTGARLQLVRALRPLVIQAYHDVADGESRPDLSYRSSLGADLPEEGAGQGGVQAELSELMLTALHRVRQQELDRGVCLVGPHRDELQLDLGGMPVRGYASHGESWSMALALRLASFALLRADGGEPVLILDDVFAELDKGRRARLAGLVGGAEQLLITAAVAEDVPDTLMGARYDVDNGQVLRAR